MRGEGKREEVVALGNRERSNADLEFTGHLLKDIPVDCSVISGVDPVHRHLEGPFLGVGEEWPPRDEMAIRHTNMQFSYRYK